MAVDANGLNLFFSGKDVYFVNPHCEKISSTESSDATASFSQNDNVENQLIMLVGHCTSPFQFELFSWSPHDEFSILAFTNDFTSRLSYRYLDHVSPPPRLA